MFKILDKGHLRFDIFIFEDIITKMNKVQRIIDIKVKKNSRKMLGCIHLSDTLTKMNVTKVESTIYIYDTQGSLVNSFAQLKKRLYLLILIIN